MIKKSFFQKFNINGLTLIELIISLTISLTIIASTYQLFHSQNNSYIKQDQVIEAQQNIRALLAIISKELQLSGYDPKGRATPGIVEQFPAPHDTFTIDYSQDTNTTTRLHSSR